MSEFVVGSIQAKVTADLSQFQAGMEEAKAESGGLGNSIGGLKDNIASFADTAAIALAAVGLGIGDLVKQSLNVAANFEQTQTSFGTLLGSEQKAADLMKQLMDFEQHTPFDIQTIANAAKEMLGFGVAQEQVVPVMSKLTDISQGQADKLNELVSVYGQVNSIQALNGRDMLRLQSIGTITYQDIADYLNKMGSAAVDAGGKVTAMTTSVVNNTKMTASARQNATDRLKEETSQLAIDEKQTGKTTAQKEALNQKEMVLKDHISEATQKLGEHSVAIGGVGSQSKIAAKDIADMIKKKEIDMNVFNGTIDMLTSKGGRFYQENIRQMNTFNGIMSSVHSQFQYLALDIMGISIGDGQIVQKGGLFYELKNAAADLLDFLKKNKDNIASGFKQVFETIMAFGSAVGQVLKPLIDYMGQHKQQTIEFLQGLALGFAALIVLIPILLLVAHPMILVLLAIEVAVGLLYVAWSNNFMGIKDITKSVITEAINFFNNYLLPAIAFLSALWANYWKENGQIIKDQFALIMEIIKFAWDFIYNLLKIGLALLTGNWLQAVVAISDAVDQLASDLSSIFGTIVDMLKNIGGKIISAMVQPFMDAKNQIVGIVKDIQGWLDFTKRHSPSVLDIVKNGVGLVNEALTGINYAPTLNSTQIAGNILPSVSGGNSYSSLNNGLTINLPNAIVSSSATANALGEKIGDAIISKLKLNIRV